MLREEQLVVPAASTNSNLLPQIALTLSTGGALWCLYYLVWIVNGLITGQAPPVGVNPIYVGVAALFVAALCALNLGLGALALSVRPRHPILGTVAALVALLGVVGPLFAFFSRVLSGETMGGPTGMSVVGSCLAATLLGAATLSSGLLPRRAAGLLLALGLVTFPLVVLLGMVANLWLPAWVTDELPFAIAGAGWLLFARLIRSL
jgi:hypothetical protein